MCHFKPCFLFKHTQKADFLKLVTLVNTRDFMVYDELPYIACGT